MDIYNIEKTKKELTLQVVSKFLAELSIFGYVNLNRVLAHSINFVEEKNETILKIRIDEPDYYNLLMREGNEIKLDDDLKKVFNAIMNKELVMHKVIIANEGENVL